METKNIVRTWKRIAAIYAFAVFIILALMLTSCSKKTEETCYICKYSYRYEYSDGSLYNPNEAHKEQSECGEVDQWEQSTPGTYQGKQGTRIEVKRCE